MIKLDIQKYCQECPHFEPKIINRPVSETLFCGNLNTYKVEKITKTTGDTTVECENKYRCASIVEYLKGVI